MTTSSVYQWHVGNLAIDRDETTDWDSDGWPNAGRDEWLTVDVGPSSPTIRWLSMLHHNQGAGWNPVNLDIEGSNDGTNWTTIAHFSSELHDRTLYRLSTPATYRYYRYHPHRIVSDSAGTSLFAFSAYDSVSPPCDATSVCDLPAGQTSDKLEHRAAGARVALVDNAPWPFFYWTYIYDDTFATWIKQAFAPGGSSKIRNATFLFQECNGGGMLDALQSILGSSIRWVGSSASTYKQEAKGLNNGVNDVSPWTDAVVYEAAQNQTTLSAVATAAAIERHRDKETEQWVSANDGDTLQLADPCATNHYAILWAGRVIDWLSPEQADGVEIYNNISKMRQLLIDKWGQGSNVHIYVLFGNGLTYAPGKFLPLEWGAQPGGSDTLHDTIDGIGHDIGPNDQFVFYASDHGYYEQKATSNATALSSSSQVSQSFSLAQDTLNELADEPSNNEGLVVRYAGHLDGTSSVAVSLNSMTLGYLEPDTDTVYLNIPEGAISQDNHVLFQSANSSAITINSVTFASGPIGGIYAATPTPTVSPTPCPIQFTDVPSTQPFYAFVRALACRGVIGGYADGTFRPGNSVTRGQVTKFVVNAAGLTDPVPPTQQTFEDVPPSHPFWSYIERLASKGYISGYTCGTGPAGPCVPPANRPYFLPGANVTRGQLAKIVANTVGFDEMPSGQLFEDVPSSSPFYTFIERIALHGVISGYNCGTGPAGGCVAPGNRPYFAPGANVTRGQTAKIVANTFYPGVPPPSNR